MKTISFLVTQEINQSSLIREEVNLFLGENYLVTFHEENSDAIDNVWQRLEESTNISKMGSYSGFVSRAR